MTRFLLTLATAALLAGFGAAHAEGAAGVAPPEAAQFDFLIGQWDLDVTPKLSGLVALIHGSPHLSGTWKAWRAFDGFGIDDEIRVVDGGGNPINLGHALRVYDPKARRWAVETLDVYSAHFASATAQWQGGEMLVNGKGTMADGKACLTRTRFYEIAPDRFKMRQDRSVDNGASWDDGTITISARRVAAKAQR